MKKGAGLYSAVRKRKRGSGTTLVGGAVRKRRRRRKKTKGSGFVAWGRGGRAKGGILRSAAQFANKFQISRKQPRATFLPGATWNPAFQKGSGVSWHSGGGVVIGGGGFRGKRVFHRQGRGKRVI